MNYCSALSPSSFVMGLTTLLLTYCQSSTHANDSIAPLSTSVEGRWQADSARAAFYHSPHRFISKTRVILPLPGEMLTVQANRSYLALCRVLRPRAHLRSAWQYTLCTAEPRRGEKWACRYYVNYQANYSFLSSARQHYRPWWRLSPRLVSQLFALKRQPEIVFYIQCFSNAFLITSCKSPFT
jgi:hypothetical protein